MRFGSLFILIDIHLYTSIYCEKEQSDAFDTLSVSVNCVWRIANAKSRVDATDRQRDYRTENIHTNRFVMGFSYLAVCLLFFLLYFCIS